MRHHFKTPLVMLGIVILLSLQSVTVRAESVELESLWVVSKVLREMFAPQYGELVKIQERALGALMPKLQPKTFLGYDQRTNNPVFQEFTYCNFYDGRAEFHLGNDERSLEFSGWVIWDERSYQEQAANYRNFSPEELKTKFAASQQVPAPLTDDSFERHDQKIWYANRWWRVVIDYKPVTDLVPIQVAFSHTGTFADEDEDAEDAAELAWEMRNRGEWEYEFYSKNSRQATPQRLSGDFLVVQNGHLLKNGEKLQLTAVVNKNPANGKYMGQTKLSFVLLPLVQVQNLINPKDYLVIKLSGVAQGDKGFMNLLLKSRWLDDDDFHAEYWN